MQDVSIRNPELIQTLNWFSNWVFSQEEVLSKLPFPRCDSEADEACSLEYLQELQKEYASESGYPRDTLGYDINSAVGSDIPDGWLEISNELDRRMVEVLGVGFNALKMYYPKNGYIGWHNNSNCPGQNLIMTYTPPGGKGYFEYQDPISKEIVRVEDKEGWTAKAGYFGSFTEPDKIFWHCARCYDVPRLTISYVVRDQWMWDEMIQDIQSDQ